MRTDQPWLLNAVPSRLDAAPKASTAASTARPGRFPVNGRRVSEGKKMIMQPGDVVVLETPGGGGYGAV